MKRILILISFVSFLLSSNAQIVLQESFDGTTFVPTGWYSKRLAPSYSTTLDLWDRVISGVTPTVAPHSGVGMARFNSPAIYSGTETDLGSLPINFSVGNFRIRFWIYRSDMTNSYDQLAVYVSTDQNSSWGTKLGTININTNKAPVETANGWYEYTFDVPSYFIYNTGYVIFRAIGNRALPIYIDDVTVEKTTCFKPLSPIATTVGKTTATITWTAPSTGSPSGYEWEVRTAGSVGSGPSGLITSGTSLSTELSASLSNLNESTQYNFYVRSVCGSEKSSWTDALTFKTICDPFSIPYIENFDAVTTGVPFCISVANLNGGNTWVSSYPSYSYSGTNALINIPGGSGMTGPLNDWFFTAPLNLEAGKCYSVSFRLAVNTYPLYRNLRLRIGTAQNAGAMGTNDIINLTNLTASNFQLIENSFSIAQTGIYFIGFQDYSDVYGAGGNVIIDDIIVTEGIGIPTNTTVSSIQPTSATFNWNIPSCGTATNYDWELRASAAPGSGVTGLISSGSTSNLTTNISSLTSNSTYSFYVRTVNGSLKSVWTNAVVFKTSCVAKSIPYSENFDAVIAPNFPYCINVEDKNAGEFWRNVANSYPRSAPNALRYESTYGGGAADDWFFTPPLNLQVNKSYRVSFYYRAYVTNEPEKLEVKFGQGASVFAMTPSAIFSNTNIINTAYVQGMADFIPNASGEFNIGFHCFSDQLSAYLRIDDILVTETPICDTVRNIVGSNITTTSAKIDWQLPFNNISDGAEWELRTSGAPGSGNTGLVANGDIISGITSTNITGLSAGLMYNFFIRNKSASFRSDWTAFIFKASCEATDVPYLENFDTGTTPGLPLCMSEEDKPDDIKWVTVADGNAVSAPGFIYHHYNIFAPVNDWFFTAPIKLYANKNYKLSFYVKSANATYYEALEVKAGNFAQSSAMSAVPLYTNSGIRNTSYEKQEVAFTPVSSGIYYFGFRSFSQANQAGIFIDDISVTENTATAIRDVTTPTNDLLLSIYPNPTEGDLMLKINRKYDAGKAVINIRDMQGRSVKTSEIKLNGSGNYLLQTAGLPAGMYLVEMLQSQSGRKQTVTIRKK